MLVILIVLMTIYPSDAWRAALQGLSIWWDILFPALFPFFVIAELMLGFGVVHFFGTLLDPMMRPLFRVPGIGGFVMAMGFASGYPVGARLTAQLWEQRLVTRDEGERLVAFTTSSDPIFLIGAVSVGFFHDVSLALILAVAHYGSAIVIGLLMRMHGKKLTLESGPATNPTISRASIFRRALQAMHHTRLQDGRSFWLMLQDAVQASLRLVMVIGGLVVFFCVILEIMSITHLMSSLSQWTASVLRMASIPQELSQSIINGIFEVTLGARSSSDAGIHLLLIHKVAVAAFILSWGGLCVHAQIVSLLNRTNLRYWPFVAARGLHSVLALVLVYVLWSPLQPFRNAILQAAPTFGFPVVSTGVGVGTGMEAGQGMGIHLLPLLYSISISMSVVALAAIAAMFAGYTLLRPLRSVFSWWGKAN
jgi:sporulation integral membrane protein YlbJ